MTVQEIFDTPAIKKVENEMIGLEETLNDTVLTNRVDWR